ncbi:hypothetical protein OUZ56_005939 [Daphnia magna]|uniref:Uncharacterized protein n=1 Tax=Daphnia magna TaxID=35525 RepID=A0ABQ9YU69_9CRUS|nr:hypothetical protein OUZ56_005939 [Daphnia magna]
MAAKRLNQATLTVTTEVLDKELHKDLKNYEDAASENRLQEAETAFKLADDRMKRLIKNYEITIPMWDAPEAQQKYLAEDIELEAIKQPEIGKIAESSKTEFVSELWSQGNQLADDRLLSGKAGPCQMDVLIGANQVWKALGSKQIVSNTGIRAIESKLGSLLLGQDEKVAISSTTAFSFLLKAKLGTPKVLQEDTDPKKEEIDFARWWKLESLDPLKKVPLSVQWNTYSEFITQDDDGHYVAAPDRPEETFGVL